MEPSSAESRLSRMGRVRKKSAKVIEMEEAEQLEKQLYKTGTPKSKRQGATPKAEKPGPALPKLVVKVEPGPQGDHVLVKSKSQPSESEDSISSPPVYIKQEPDESSDESIPEFPQIESFTAQKSVKKGKKRAAAIETEETEIPKPTIPEKRFKEEEPELCIDTDGADDSASDEEKFIGSPEESETVDVEDTSFDLVIATPPSAPQRANAKAKKESNKKPTKAGGKKKTQTQDQKEKKKRAPTAYLLWCYAERALLVARNPDANFAHISKMLGDRWKSLPEKDKLQWKSRAKKQTAKGSTIIKTGKVAQKTATQTTTNAAPVPPQNNVSANKTPNPVHDLTILYKNRGNIKDSTPLDVAAHFKLLGDALSLLGKRIQEHKGHLEVQGSLSVMLDSLLSALGPLVCLTNLLPETDGCPSEVHAATLDNIAYIMPGIG